MLVTTTVKLVFWLYSTNVTQIYLQITRKLNESILKTPKINSISFVKKWPSSLKHSIPFLKILIAGVKPFEHIQNGVGNELVYTWSYNNLSTWKTADWYVSYVYVRLLVLLMRSSYITVTNWMRSLFSREENRMNLNLLE